MYRDDLGREWHGPIPFRADRISENAPPSFGVYQVLYTADGERHVAYIGIATGDTIRGRLLKHVRGRGNWALARVTDVESLECVWYPCDPQTARQIESHVCTRRKPPYNVRPEYANFIPSIAVH
jgi:excinuclease UvrABC nuclease subunit